ncbi:MAG TPA: MSMEG_0570 family nitrogen starvation response protein [Polyangiales bacterium]|nr:MSMEG_0570 family nitrogen starvation response protein [Polyangiales bacterium]
MPEMYFDVTWPSGKRERCYSPSLVIEDHLTVGRSYPVDEFVALARTALQIAAERVRQKYGFYCSAARDQLAHIEATAERLTRSERAGQVRVEAFARSPSG